MNLSLLGIFLEGLLSFLSPCVLPLVPLYMSYLAGDNKTIDEQGNVKYNVKKVFISTLFFVFGICFTLLLLSVSINVFKGFISKYHDYISILCGILLIIFGLHEIGIININILNSDKRFIVNLDLKKMNYFKAFLLGFIFSFGWSPCIGPMLANALMLVATGPLGYLYIVFYGLGLVIPFIITGLLTTSVINFINSKKDIIKWVLKVAGIIMICFGIYMIVDAYDNSKKIDSTIEITKDNLLDIQFKNQYDKVVQLSDYRGKYIILNFTATWCTYCNQEIPEYLDFSSTNDDVKCLYVMSASSSRVDDEKLLTYINSSLKMDVIIDENDRLVNYFGITGYPTKIVISPDGIVLGYIPGYQSLDNLNDIMQQARQINNQ